MHIFQDTNANGAVNLKIGDEAFHGVLRDIVDVATKESEASPVAVAANTIALFSATIGRNVFQRIGDGIIHCRPYPVLVGDTSKGRKGTSESTPVKIFERIDEVLGEQEEGYWPLERVSSGLSSGEGLAYAIRDSSGEDDEGVVDKRLHVTEAEFANVLEKSKRHKTLSSMIRNAWDGKTLRVMTRKSPIRATDPHIVITGHITQRELVAMAKEVDIHNGFLNRFLLLHVMRPKLVPLPRTTPTEEIDRLVERLVPAIEFARERREVRLSEAAKQRWASIYMTLAKEQPGVVGALMSRAEPYTLMLAMIFAVLDCQEEIAVQHLDAALAWVNYARATAELVFGGIEHRQKQQLAEHIYGIIRDNGEATLTEITNGLGRHKTRQEIQEALEYLLDLTPALITSRKEKTAGRPITIYSLFNEEGRVNEVRERDDSTEVTDLVPEGADGDAEANGAVASEISELTQRPIEGVEAIEQTASVMGAEAA